jgi:Ca2+-binding EF-hand superfamily protein
VFTQIDKDYDGALTSQDLSLFLANFDIYLTEKELTGLITRFDPEESHFVTRDKFIGLFV